MDTTVISRLHALRQMSMAELREEWFRLFGESARSRSHDHLWRRLAWRVQELAHGGLSDDAKARIDELVPDLPKPRTRATQARRDADPAPEPTRPRDPRLPSPGTVLLREYRGRELRLAVLDDGYELDGVRYGSLSAAARAVTGSRWNGRLFWGLTKRKR